MLRDRSRFQHRAQVSWPRGMSWPQARDQVEAWLRINVGAEHQSWTWDDSTSDHMGLAFFLEKDLVLFVLAWSH